MLVTHRSKRPLDSLSNSSFTTKRLESLVKNIVSVVDAGYLLFIEMFLFCHSYLNIQH